MRNIFGPVASRRLGLSLGVDLVPHKTCNLDCVYCECGRTTRFITEPTLLNRADEILAELARILENQGERLDYVTLSGAGEPTLNLELGKIVNGIKEMTSVKTAVITNSTLLHRPEVRQALSRVDLIMPSLDSGLASTFGRINRPHPGLTLDYILKGLYLLRQEFKGEVWLEILLAVGINDSPADLEALAREVEKIQPERVQLNTVDRPPPEEGVRPVGYERLLELRDLFKPRAEVIAKPRVAFKPASQRALEEDILEVIDRRPSTVEDLSTALGRKVEEIESILKVLMVKGRVRPEPMGEKTFMRGIFEEG